MNLQELVPKHKSDFIAIENLKLLSFEEIKPIVTELLEWLQDFNWPVAAPIAEMLSPYLDKMVPEVMEVLKTNDGVWKFWILTTLLTNTHNPILLKELERIANFPTKDEVEEGVDKEAMVILRGGHC